MKKQIIVLGLAVLGAIAVNHTASAQTMQPGIGTKMSTFTLADKGIKVDHTILSAPGKANFSLTNVSGKDLERGSTFLLTLPKQNGLVYDLSTLKTNTGDAVEAGPPYGLAVASSFSANSQVSFTCNLVKSAEQSMANQVIVIRKK